MPVLRNIRRLVSGRFLGSQSELEVIEGAALAWENGRITWVGSENRLPSVVPEGVSFDARGCLVIPGLIDCHTHLVFGGWRTSEFVLRARGSSYLEIAQSGGGILSTVAATRAASTEELVERAFTFLAEMAGLGITTVECKSGYGLDPESEQKILESYARLARLQPVRLVPTLLAAHVVPPEYAERRDDYVNLVCDRIIPEVAGRNLARFCDVFVEEGAFTVAEARRILETGARWGLKPRVHVDQLTDQGGAQLAAEVGALSADHLEHVSAAGIARLAEAGVTAVTLPLASLFLRQPPLQARRLLEAGVGVAVATDFNPGSAPTYHLPLALSLACVLSGLTPAEAVMGATWFAARALGMEREIGSLEVGKRADFALLDAESCDHWLYHFRPNACLATFVGGARIWPPESPGRAN